MKLSSVRLVSENVPALAQFYGRVTETSPVGGADYTEISTPGATVALCSVEALRAASPGAAPPQELTNSSLILEFEVDNVDALRERMSADVPDWVQEPTDQPWGNRSMLVRDPDGNLINFFTPVPGATRDWPSQNDG